MAVINDLWSNAAAARPRTASLNYIPVPATARYAPLYTGGYRDRHSRYDLRCLRRYGGGYFYDAPLVVLWADDDHDYDDGYTWGGSVDVWGL